MKTKLTLIRGDITTLKVNGIVNAAAPDLLGGGGVDGAIHVAAGPELLVACRKLSGCATGEAKITKGYNLLADYVIHTVGPVYGAEHGREEKLLAASYKNSLVLAQERGLKTIAFPCISTGIFHFPKDKAAKIAITTIKDFITQNSSAFNEIIFVTHEESDFKIYQSLGNFTRLLS